VLKYKTYAENVRMAGKTRDNPQRRPVAIREVANALHVSYEAIRRIWMGRDRLTISEVLNNELCDYLGLPKHEMWALAQAEKFSQKAGYVPLQLVEDREGREISANWELLDEEQRQTILRMVRSFAKEQQPKELMAYHSA